MTISFAIIAALTLAAAIAAMSLRNLVHCALWLTVAFGGWAALYLQLGAQFVGLAQILIYVGALAILVVFAILLTRGSDPQIQPIVSSSWLTGVAIAALVFGSLAVTILSSSLISLTPQSKSDPAADATVKNIGTKLMTDYVLPLEVIGLLLTVALIGAVIVAMREKQTNS